MRDPRLTAHAKTMRTNATEAETRLWLALRAKRFAGHKFRRQKVVGPYIVDFASREPTLIIEVDGDGHALQPGYDAERTDFLRHQGYDVIRFANADVVGNLEGGLSAIETRLLPPLPTLSPAGERAIGVA
ncbi:conserved hypothetical protein [Sphingobium sp. SYK-6]|uniref:endonuclease domain-containing protein n=1 Tax=Sphingobium sp. (strain NBRC 103272 / SYK-6) TaxID=627192 RepID=UPI0002277447|nr:DUF559 domain-containing protein [Sphingobium sp. SYK-6]BAK66045.1 conserved hypothetical protein [Sphingobium sp. SYK-6]